MLQPENLAVSGIVLFSPGVLGSADEEAAKTKTKVAKTKVAKWPIKVESPFLRSISDTECLINYPLKPAAAFQQQCHHHTSPVFLFFFIINKLEGPDETKISDKREFLKEVNVNFCVATRTF